MGCLTHRMCHSLTGCFTSNKPVDFCGDPNHDPDPGIFNGICCHRGQGEFDEFCGTGCLGEGLFVCGLRVVPVRHYWKRSLARYSAVQTDARARRPISQPLRSAASLPAVIYTNLNISDSAGACAALMFTAGCQSVISRRTFPVGLLAAASDGVSPGSRADRRRGVIGDGERARARAEVQVGHGRNVPGLRSVPAAVPLLSARHCPTP